MDFGAQGLADTLTALSDTGLRAVGAGSDAEEARRPAIVTIEDNRRVVIASYGMASSGIPSSWAATFDQPGVNFVPELSADPLSWLADQLADPDAVLARAGIDTDEVTEADRKGLAAAAPEIVAAVKRMLDGVRDGTLAPAPAEPVAAARTGWL